MSELNLVEPNYESPCGRARLYLGDYREVLPTFDIPSLTIVADPPYGMRNNADYSRFSGGKKAHGRRRDGGGGATYKPIEGDDQPQDLSMIIQAKEAIIWGLPHHIGLPPGGGLVWVKRKPEAFGSFCSDAELAWVKGSKGVFCFTSYPQRMARCRVHPNQKPVDLMRWCIQRTKGAVITDTHMGSGSTGVAAILEGRDFIGIESDQRYFEIAKNRIMAELRDLAQPKGPPCQTA